MHTSLLVVILLGLVEGLTEFIPVSSTGHLVLAGALMGLPPGSATFDIVIQLGAILAVVVVYRQRFAGVLAGLARRDPGAIRFTRNVLLGFLPSAVVGALAYGAIKRMLEQPVIVAVALVVGGVAILLIERLVPKPQVTHEVEAMPWRTALGIGMVQCLSMVPGVSRSGATIMGALTLGVDRRVAAEYSFFLAIPTMCGATALALYKARDEIGDAYLAEIAVGFGVSFLVALVVIRWFVGIVSRHGFAPFAWYRIVAGVAALLWLSGR